MTTITSGLKNTVEKVIVLLTLQVLVVMLVDIGFLGDLGNDVHLPVAGVPKPEIDNVKEDHVPEAERSL